MIGNGFSVYEETEYTKGKQHENKEKLEGMKFRRLLTLPQNLSS